MTERKLPAYPLFVKDPEFSLWSMSDDLTAESVKSWAGECKPMYGFVKTEEGTFCFLGDYTRVQGCGVRRAVQTSVQVTAFTTDYRFTAGKAEVCVSFVSPLLLTDIAICSMPVCYLNYEVTGVKSAEVSLFVNRRICYNDISQTPSKEVRGGVVRGDGFEAAVFGLKRQMYLSHNDDGRGADFGDVDGIYGTVDYDNLMEFTDEVLKRYPEIDENRIGVTGGSYGGFMTNWIVGHTNRFAAAASQRSIANWISYEHSSDIGHNFVLKDLGGNTRTVPELLWKQSPLQYAPACKTPILFIHSDQDYRCYMAEGLAMFSAVKRNGCPAKMCLFHGENHELSRSGKPENRIDRMAEILNWMDTYLK